MLCAFAGLESLKIERARLAGFKGRPCLSTKSLELLSASSFSTNQRSVMLRGSDGEVSAISARLIPDSSASSCPLWAAGRFSLMDASCDAEVKET